MSNESHYHSKKDRVFVRAIQGDYSLKQELARLRAMPRVRKGSEINVYASDFAKPTKFYARSKKILDASNTRWTGSSAIERDEFQIAVVTGGGDNGTTKSVDTGSPGVE